MVDGPANGELEITLAAKQEVYEHVDVTASRGGEAFAPESVASTVIKTEDKAAAPATLAELVEGVAGVLCTMLLSIILTGQRHFR